MQHEYLYQILICDVNSLIDCDCVFLMRVIEQIIANNVLGERTVKESVIFHCLAIKDVIIGNVNKFLATISLVKMGMTSFVV